MRSTKRSLRRQDARAAADEIPAPGISTEQTGEHQARVVIEVEVEPDLPPAASRAMMIAEHEARVLGDAHPAGVTASEFCRALIAAYKTEYAEREIDIEALIRPDHFTFTIRFADDPENPLKFDVGRERDIRSSEVAEHRHLRMRDDLNTKVKKARTEALGRLVDLNNPALAPDERLRRARRLVGSYQRRRAEDPDFPASPEVLTAFSIVNKANYQRRKAAKPAQKTTLAM